MPDIEFIRGEIERMRRRVQRQRSEIRQLQRAGIPCASAEALLDRMLNGSTIFVPTAIDSIISPIKGLCEVGHGEMV